MIISQPCIGERVTYYKKGVLLPDSKMLNHLIDKAIGIVLGESKRASERERETETMPDHIKTVSSQMSH